MATLALVDIFEDCLALLRLHAALVHTSDTAPHKFSVDNGVRCRPMLHLSGQDLISRQLFIHQKVEDGLSREGAAISLTAMTTTCTRAVGPGGGGLELVAACSVEEVPGLTAIVPGPGAMAAVPGPPAEVLVLASGSSSRIRLLQEGPAQRWSHTLVMA